VPLWKESFDDAVEEIFFNLPFILFIWFVATWFVEQLRFGSIEQITAASFALMGIVVFLVIFEIVFLIKMYSNMRFFVLKENQEYAKKRIGYREIFKKQIIFDEKGEGDV